MHPAGLLSVTSLWPLASIWLQGRKRDYKPLYGPMW
ncbi:hypothetical protein [Enterocloster phage PMBT24]|uniref:Uncharacterized protein n=1 Tax=Enterocloster phage PMBT24 TaxID=3025413 RepID=A0AAT9TR59_9CAUD|nr:hypothetical protein [Enterocloster phage PMBT24]